MPKGTDIHKVLIIGSGPIIIGQACEFDYSGTQACKALRKLGYEIVLVNSNPATIMTDPDVADVTYIEPLNCERLTEIIKKERPDALLPNLGGQSGLNLCSELDKAGVLKEYNVQVIGVQVDAIERGEDRIEFKNTMASIGVEMARSQVAYSVDEAVAIASQLGYPVVLRPAYTMGGAGGGMVYNVEELKVVCARGLQASLIGQVLVEECITGWEELELEVVRDAKNNMITVCFIENIDPVGVHTGDSFCSAPMLTISEDVQLEMQRQAYRIVEKIEVIGGCNCQFAHDPVSGRIVCIEINPRTSRSSALASKATGFPIALVSAMLAAGMTLDEIECGKYGTLDRYVPSGDYVVIKFARWAFEKFKGAEDKLGTQMRAVGEVMSIGKTYKEAFQKAIRSLEIGQYGLGFAKNLHEKTKAELLAMLVYPTSMRQFVIYEALRKGASIEELYNLTRIKHWFLEQMKELVDEENALLACKGSVPPVELLRQAKLDGFSDRYLSEILAVSESDIRAARYAAGIKEAWELANQTILSGQINASSTAQNAYHVVFTDKGEATTVNPVVLDGLTVMYGQTDDKLSYSTKEDEQGRGGGEPQAVYLFVGKFFGSENRLVAFYAHQRPRAGADVHRVVVIGRDSQHRAPRIMGRREHDSTVESHFFLHFFRKFSDHGPRHGYRAEHFGIVPEHLDQLIVPVICLRAYQLSCRGVGVLIFLHASEQEMEIIRDHQDALRLLQVLRMRLFHCHELIDGIKDLLLDPGPSVQLILGDHLIHFLVHALCAAVTVSHGIAKDPVILIEQHIVNAPCVDGHGNRDLANLFTFFKAIFDLRKKTVHIPAEGAVLIVHPVGETVHLFELHLPVLHAGKHVAPAGCPDINSQIISVHLLCLLLRLSLSVFIIIRRNRQKKDAIYIKQRPYLQFFFISAFFLAFFTNLFPAFCINCLCILSGSSRTAPGTSCKNSSYCHSLRTR